MACLNYYSMDRHSDVFSLICPAWTINVGVSPLYFSCFFAVCPWCIYNGIASAFIYISFSASMRDAMKFFTGTNHERLMTNLFHRLGICSTICCLSSKGLHTSCILIALHLSSEKCFLPIPNNCWKTPHVGLILQLMVLEYTESIAYGQQFLIL